MRRTHPIVLAMLLVAGCSGDDDSTDAGLDGGGAADGGPVSDAGGGSGNGAGFGAACERSADCGDRLSCDEEVDTSFVADDLPPGVARVPSSVFPGGLCSPTPAAPYDPTGARSCDPLAPVSHQGCGSKGVCIVTSLEQRSTPVVACRPQCEPSATESGCARSFYTCDFDLKACVEGCQSDEECRLRLLDSDGDGRADALAYDDESQAECDPETFRCTHDAAGESGTGEPCERLDDCEPDGTCIEPLQTFADHRFPGGACTKLGCNIEGRECSGENVTCERLRSFRPGVVTAPACLQRCTVGAEPEADRLGPEGHGQGCREGYRCHYNGGSGAESGVCVGGNYNAVTDYNLGAACERDEDCYSPYGLGVCLRLSVSGTNIQPPTGLCSLWDCNAPGIPDDVCGPNAQCIGLSGDVTFCARTCTSAEQCAEGYACTDDDGDPATDRICYPVCLADEDCRGDETCRVSPGTGIGACVAS